MDAVTGYGYKFLNLTDNSTAAERLMKNGAGKLHTVTINRAPSTGGDVAIYDSADDSGTVIATITMATPTATITWGPVTLVFDIALTTGLYVEPDDTIAGYDFTITYI